ncbi:IclR family transcriptional regulator [Ammoniphilus sp. CFH 90114]|uniref:IclR family transcriptional regulator n=1 Tax=Ammoniphilus sp. CFH 90114 TaxID=2493665 RepID=UPI00100F32F4|nr:IclR family transcriptional regulator [Ammoniphilus sp. CFH 90114]RXT05226.1 IclR family transcriptional regulator [Ammoniphilus sp. CFH 90114]
MNQSVIKALSLLDLFSPDKTELSLAEIAKLSELTKPTAYRLLSSLETCGFVSKVKYSEQDIRYRLGLKLLELGNMVLEQSELRKVALPFMKQLAESMDEAVHLVVVDGEEAVYIEKVDSKQPIRLFTSVGKRSPLHLGSASKLLLAYMNNPQKEQLIENMEFVSMTPNSITSAERLKEELDKILQNGYSISDGEQTLETIGLSLPIKDHTGAVVASLTISGMKSRFNKERMPILLEETEKAADLISRDLGYIKGR